MQSCKIFGSWTLTHFPLAHTLSRWFQTHGNWLFRSQQPSPRRTTCQNRNTVDEATNKKPESKLCRHPNPHRLLIEASSASASTAAVHRAPCMLKLSGDYVDLPGPQQRGIPGCLSTSVHLQTVSDVRFITGQLEYTFYIVTPLPSIHLSPLSSLSLPLSSLYQALFPPLPSPLPYPPG